MRRTLKLKGAFEKATVVLAGVQFVEGEATLDLPGKDMEGICKYLRRCYQAIPKEEFDGERDVSESGSEGTVQPVPRNLQKGGWSPEKGTDFVGTDADAKKGKKRIHAKGNRPERPLSLKVKNETKADSKQDN